jgi:alginate O-acetyltransferase complex protein AlgI
MLFCSQEFLLFFLVVFAAYWAIPWRRPRVWLLLAASFYFYASWNQWLALIVFAATTVNFGLARALESCRAACWRRVLVGLSVAGNLGLICYFKYANFFLRSLEEALRAAGASASLPLLSVILPFGISFYTFEAISYVVDVYRGRVRASRDLAAFLLFILFFPHLVAGPIVRAYDFLPQVARPKHWSWLRLQVGAQLFLMGLFKKFAIADRMALYVDPVFANPENYRGGALWLGVLAYALQIYCDFSGYTDMALGTAHVFGYKLARNFNMPYLALNPSEFWRRWHISLSTWLRDYLFIPLGGSRGGPWQTARNLLITMALGGLWHGANWTFVAWGLMHGLWLILHRLFQGFCRPRPLLQQLLLSWPGTVARWSFTFVLVCVGWVFFRAQSFGTALTVLEGLVTVPKTGLPDPVPAVGLSATVLVVVLCHSLAHKDLWKRIAERLPSPVLGTCYALVLVLALLLAPGTSAPFIYFQF